MIIDELIPDDAERTILQLQQQLAADERLFGEVAAQLGVPLDHPDGPVRVLAAKVLRAAMAGTTYVNAHSDHEACAVCTKTHTPLNRAGRCLGCEMRRTSARQPLV